ncbi:unnamed protein product [Haemonchus placei]|uniref:SEA domain-containing protein n=1 Tax=Haemonchus placei TaxID=6290 RepID=A0A0N4WW47_HAEPC|nr:unnamed protein product [Haemonchus placei]
MKLLVVLILAQIILSHSLPTPSRQPDSEKSLIRRIRSNESNPPPTKGGRIVKVFGYAIRIPPIVVSVFTSIKNFFVGPSGVITKIKDFLQGHSTVSANFFGRKIDFQANVPLSKEDVEKSINSFLHKLRTDPMTRVLFVMYLNVVVVIVVFLALLAKHTQISLQLMRQKKGLSSSPSVPTKTRAKGEKTPIVVGHPPDTPKLNTSIDSDGPVLPETTMSGERTDDWDSKASPTLVNVSKPETRLSQPMRRLIKDLSALSESSTQDSDSTDGSDITRYPFPNESNINSGLEAQPSSARTSNYFTAMSALETTGLSYVNASQFIPTLPESELDAELDVSGSDPPLPAP